MSGAKRRIFPDSFKREGDQQSLPSRVFGQAAYGVFDDGELACLDAHPVKDNGPDDDSKDGKERERRAVCGRAEDDGRWHVVAPLVAFIYLGRWSV